MRGFLVIVGLVVGTVLGALPAHAHTAAQPDQTGIVAARAAAPATVPGQCHAEQRALARTEAAGPTHTHEHDADHEHDPTDHQHQLGDDIFHQMAAHGFPDFAAHVEFAPKRNPCSVALAFPLRQDVAKGIALVPPVPPPLS